MSHLSHSRFISRLVKIQAPQHQQGSQITPKKESPEIKFEQIENQSTLQKIMSFGNQVMLRTVKKDKKKPKRPWTPQEDTLLIQLVQNKGPKQWAFISSYFNERCGKQCRERWHNHLRTGIKKGDWSFEEEWLLFLGVQAYGKRWSIISKILEGRTQNTLKNHWNCKLKPKKENLAKKLTQVLRSNSVSNRLLTKCEFHLIRLIKERPLREEENFQNQSQNTQKIINLFKSVINNFLESKRAIYSSYEVETKTEEVKIEQEPAFEWNVGSEFFKNQRLKKEEKETEIKLQNFTNENEVFDQHQPFGMINDFGSDSNSFNMKMNGLMKEVSNVEEEDFDEIEGHEFDVSGWSEEDVAGDSIQESKQSQPYKFGSPLKRNIFAGMDLEESNKGKKMFEQGEQESKGEMNE